MDAATAVANFLEVQNIFNLIARIQLIAYMWPQPACVQDGAKYDFIIVGGGTAGCVVASALAEYDVSVLLVEAGGNPRLESLYPDYFAYPKHSINDWNFTSIRDETMQYHKGCVSDITQGKMLGGSSSLNYMAYVHGNPADFDNWASITNDASWSYDAVLPLFIRSEGVNDPGILNSPEDKAFHGLNGTIKLRKYYDEINEKYFSALKEIGHKIVPDINARNPLGFTNVLFAASNKYRSTTANFLKCVKNKQNLDVLSNALVTKILFDDDKTAVGVKIKTKDGKTITVKANKEVIISAGVFKTPQLLMVSGIGPKQHLKEMKIEVLKDLPVGKNLQDHALCISVFRMGKAKSLSRPPNPHLINFPAIGGYASLKKSQKYPDYGILNLIIDEPEIFLVICSISFGYTNEVCDNIFKGAGGKQISVVCNFLTEPKSRGQVLLNTTNMEEQPTIILGYYSNDDDLEKHVKTIADFNKVLKTSYYKSVGAELIDPKLEVCADFDKDSKEYRRCYALNMVTTGHYYAGTCAMGQVVRSNLLVIGVQNLRVVDASIMPTIVANPTLATVIMIAQKAVDMIVEEHEL